MERGFRREDMLLAEIKKIFHKELDELYGENEVSSFFYLLIEHYLNLERFALALQPNLVIEKNEETPLFDALSQLKLQKPIQHILGYTHFMDLKFQVGPAVLIPRPETEELVRWILDDVGTEDNHELRILDIGTGSGCISIALAKNLQQVNVYSCDISGDALTIAQSNADVNEVKVNFFQSDILSSKTDIKIEFNFDIIVSNPPYVRELEKNEMSVNVVDHEPGIALFVPDEDPLLFYRAIARFAEQYLVSGGSLYLEINQYLGKEMVNLLENYTFKNIELRQDMFGNDRMIKAVRS